MSNNLKHRTSAIGKVAQTVTLAAALSVIGCKAEPPASVPETFALKTMKKAPASQRAPASTQAASSQIASASQEANGDVSDVIAGLRDACKDQTVDGGPTVRTFKVNESLKLKGTPEVVVHAKTDWGVVLVTRKNGVDIKADPAPYGSMFGMFTPVLAKNPKTRGEAVVLVCPKAEQPEDKGTVKMATATTISIKDILVKGKVPAVHKKKEKLQEEVRKLQEQLKNIQGSLETNGD